MTFRGVFSGGHIVVSDPSVFRDGDVVEIRPSSKPRAKLSARKRKSSRKAKTPPVPGTKKYVAALLAGAGAWSHRKDIGDSAAYGSKASVRPRGG